MINSDRNTHPGAPKALTSGIVPRAFLLRWNEKKIWHECWGCQFPNGLVMLDFGRPYDDMGDLLHSVGEFGENTLYWLDEVEDEDR